MANEKRLIDAKKALYLAEYSGLYDFDLSALETLLFDEPCLTVDAVEVVRCAKCKRCMMCYPEKQIGKEATPGWYCKEFKGWRRPDDFCSYGERRAE